MCYVSHTVTGGHRYLVISFSFPNIKLILEAIVTKTLIAFRHTEYIFYNPQTSNWDTLNNINCI